MSFLCKGIAAPIACAILSTAALFACATPATAAVAGPPRSSQVAIGLPDAIKNTVKGTELVRVTTGNLPNITSVKLKFYSGPTLVQEVEPQNVAPGLNYYTWDTTTFHHVSARLVATALIDDQEVAISASPKSLQVVNPFMTGNDIVKANKPAHFTGRFPLPGQVAHVYQCWNDVIAPGDIAANCDTAHVVDKLYRNDRVSVTTIMRAGTAPHRTDRVVMTVTNGSSVITLLEMPITVLP